MSRDPWSRKESVWTLDSPAVLIRTEPGLTVTADSVALESKLRREWGTDALIRTRLASGTFDRKTFVLRVEPR